MDAPRTNPIAASNWTARVQLTLAFLLGAILTILVGNYFSFFASARPTDRERIIIITSVDVNHAGKAELMQLPGVGDALADDILMVRAERGSFANAEDLQHVKGIGPKRLEAIRPFVRFDGGSEVPAKREYNEPADSIRGGRKIAAGDAKIDVNRATTAELQSLPGIGPVLAQRIISTREKEPFRKVDDLRRVSGIGVKTLEKLRPFVTCASTEASDFAGGSR